MVRLTLLAKAFKVGSSNDKESSKGEIVVWVNFSWQVFDISPTWLLIVFVEVLHFLGVFVVALGDLVECLLFECYFGNGELLVGQEFLHTRVVFLDVKLVQKGQGVLWTRNHPLELIVVQNPMFLQIYLSGHPQQNLRRSFEQGRDFFSFVPQHDRPDPHIGLQKHQGLAFADFLEINPLALPHYLTGFIFFQSIIRFIRMSNQKLIS